MYAVITRTRYRKIVEGNMEEEVEGIPYHH